MSFIQTWTSSTGDNNVNEKKSISDGVVNDVQNAVIDGVGAVVNADERDVVSDDVGE